MGEEEEEDAKFIVKYAETTKTTFMCTSVAVALTMVFVMSPLSSFLLTSVLAKMIIVVLLVYAIYFNTVQTTGLKNRFKSTTVDTNINVICGYTFSVFLSFLLLSVLFN